MARYSTGDADYYIGTGTRNVPILSNSNGPFTIVFWIKVANLTQSNVYLLQAYQASAPANQWAIIWEYTNNTIEFYSSGGSGTDPRTNSGIVLSDINWHHVAYRKSASGASNWDKFVDGSKTSINSSINFTLAIVDAFLNFCSNSGNRFNGTLCDVGIWNVALTDNQILSLATDTLPTSITDISSLIWLLRQAGSTEEDQSPNNYDGDIYNVTLVDNPFESAGLTKSVADTLDAFNDTLTLLFNYFNNFEDALTFLDIINIPLSGIEVSDQINYNYAWKGSVDSVIIGIPKSLSDFIHGRNKNQPALRDSLDLQVNDNTVQLADCFDIIGIEDNDETLYPTLSYLILPSTDAISILDTFFRTLDGLLSQSDSLTLSDNFSLFAPLPLTFTDSFTFSDTVALFNQLFKSVSSRFILQEAAQLRLDHLLTKSDSFTLSDLISLLYNYKGTNLDDFITFNDDVSLLHFVTLLRSASDSFTLLDAVIKLLSTNTIAYLRRYLNDNPGAIVIPIYLKTGQSIKHVDDIVYLRRYLNDIATTSSQPGDSVSLGDSVSVSLN